MKRALATLVLTGVTLHASAQTPAGMYSEDLARCLVSSMTTRDKTDLVRWMFSNAALHPEAASIAAVGGERRDDINRTAGRLLQRLLTESCRKQMQEALKYEGAVAMQVSFQVLGRVAMQELMSNAAVSQGFGEIGKYVDGEKLKELAAPGQ